MCLEAIDACLTRQAGDPFCDGDILMTCGPDGLTADVETECVGVCENDACNDNKDQCPEGDFSDCELDCGGADVCLPDEGCKTLASAFNTDGPPTSVRLPAYSGLCDEECASGRRGLTISVYSEVGERVKATVGSPWLMVASQEPTGLMNACGIEEPGTPGGLIFERENSGSLYLYVFTEDPTAEPRNVSFEIVDEAESFP